MDLSLSGAGVQDLYVVSGANVVLGHLSHRRLGALLLAEHRSVHTRRQLMERIVNGTVKELMEGEVVFARPEEELDDVLCRFIDHDLQDMVVLDAQGVLVGRINLNTVLREIRKRPGVIE